MNFDYVVGGGDSRPVLLTLRGDIDMLSAPHLTEGVTAALACAAGSVSKILVVDFSGVEFCGSVGLRVLAQLAEAAVPCGVALRIVASGVVRRLLSVAGFDRIFDLHQSVVSALDEVQSEESTGTDG